MTSYANSGNNIKDKINLHIPQTRTYKDTIEQIDAGLLAQITEQFHKIHRMTLNSKGAPNPKCDRRMKYLNTVVGKLVEAKMATTNLRKLAVIEAIHYNVHMELTVLCNFRLITVMNPASILRAVSDFWVFDLSNKCFRGGTPPEIFSAAWDGEDFIDVVYDASKNEYLADTHVRFLIMGKELQFFRERKLVEQFYPILETLMEYDFDDLDITLVDGVPGCGKTTEILEEHAREEDLVCTTTKAANTDYLNKTEGNPMYYRTYDSALLNPVPNADILWADEGLMTHAGELLLVAYKCNARKVRILGDSLQIPFVSRALGFSHEHSILKFDTIEKRLTSYRLPNSMTEIMKQKYPGYTCGNSRLGTIKVVHIKSINQVVWDADVTITFTQNEKEQCNKKTNTTVNTIHEVEGKTYDSVNVVRTVVHSNPIYEKDEYCIVGMSRHKKNITYYTVDTNDKLSKLLLGHVTDKKAEVIKEESKYLPFSISPCMLPIQKKRVRYLKAYDKSVGILDYLKRTINLLGNQRVSYEEIVWETPSPIDTRNEQDIDVAIAQLIYDALFERVDEKKQEEMLSESIFPLSDQISVDFVKLLSYKISEETYCDPVLKTVQPKRYNYNLVQTLAAIEKRNLNPPKVHLVRYPNAADEIEKTFMETYIDEKKLDKLMKEHLYQDAAYTEDWFAKRPESGIKTMEGYELNEYNKSKFASTVKPDMKPKLDGSHNVELIAGQTLTVHHPLNTALFAGAFKVFGIILKGALLDKWAMNDGINLEQLDGFTNRILHGHDKINALEVDFSKFDKSQEELVLNITEKILLRFGMPKFIVDQWIDCHKSNVLIFFKMGISLKTKFQRRSGDAFTFIGNTLVCMVALGHVYDLKRALGGIFAGDDSVIFMPGSDVIPDKTKLLAELFNLIAKIEWFKNAIMFASKFLIHASGSYHWIADPIKVITKLGRHDMYCKEHVELYWDSFKDNCTPYLNNEVRHKLSLAVKIRYNRSFITNVDIDVIPEFIASVVRQKSKFIKLYTAPYKIWSRVLKPTLKFSITREYSLRHEEVTIYEMF